MWLGISSKAPISPIKKSCALEFIVNLFLKIKMPNIKFIVKK
jgi:hypothetical protein